MISYIGYENIILDYYFKPLTKKEKFIKFFTLSYFPIGHLKKYLVSIIIVFL